MEHQDEIRALYWESRWTERQIARHLELPAASVHYALVNEKRKKTGRPRKTTRAVDRSLLATSLEQPFRTAVELRTALAPAVSLTTVRRRLYEGGQRCRIPARKPVLKPEHVSKRLTFAACRMGWGLENWKKVVFSDEKIFRASCRGPVVVYRPKTSRRHDRQFVLENTEPRGKNTICVWMAFGGGGKVRELELVKRPTLNADYYIDVLLPTIEEACVQHDLTFMQDLSSIHVSQKAKRWFDDRNVPWMSEWPPKGPDMNPVENVWAELVRLVQDRADNRTQLWENVHLAFHSLSASYFEKLVESMPKRIDSVASREGHWSKY